jgi:hypothetical protein
MIETSGVELGEISISEKGGKAQVNVARGSKRGAGV